MKSVHLWVLLSSLLLLGACKKTDILTQPPTISNIVVSDPFYHFTKYNFSNIGTDITFTAKATNAKSYTWNFDDGGPDTTTSIPTITHTFLYSSQHKVILTVTNASGQQVVEKLNNLNVDVYAGLTIDSLDVYPSNTYPNTSDPANCRLFKFEMDGSTSPIGQSTNSADNSGQGAGGWSFNSTNCTGFPVYIGNKIILFDVLVNRFIDYYITQNDILSLFTEADVATLASIGKITVDLPVNITNNSWAGIFKLHLGLQKN